MTATNNERATGFNGRRGGLAHVYLYYSLLMAVVSTLLNGLLFKQATSFLQD
ncbi:hypothetical protein EDD85DRAFT_961932 [Armillaria nabsnona]|nr:hypothetical protein EDD85DRAFT_961932 [Armillaria nabsnona]